MSDSHSPWPVFWLAAAGTFLAYLDVTIVNIAFPSIAGDFSGAGLGELSWVVNAYALAFAALLVIFGRAADRIGRRRIYLAGTALFAAPRPRARWRRRSACWWRRGPCRARRRRR